MCSPGKRRAHLVEACLRGFPGGWDYEEKVFPIDKPAPVAAIGFRMEQQGLEPKDLVPLLGSRSRVSEVLSGRRNLSLKMIRNLVARWGIPAEVLLGPV